MPFRLESECQWLNDTSQDRAHRKNEIYSLKSGLYRYAQLTGAHENSFKNGVEGIQTSAYFLAQAIHCISTTLWKKFLRSLSGPPRFLLTATQHPALGGEAFPFTPRICFDLGPSEGSVHARFSCCLGLLGCAHDWQHHGCLLGSA